MARIGACGIACEVCRAYINNACPMGGCTSGVEAKENLEVQRRVLGFNCPILQCANSKGVDYCMKSCRDFPCKLMFEVEFPYSKKFLEVMKRAQAPQS